MKKYLFADVESHNVGAQYGMTPREFFRLGQYAWNDGPVIITTDYDEMIRVIREADYVLFHNGISFDLPVLFGLDSTEPLMMAVARKVLDTYYLAHLLTPAPAYFKDKKGQGSAPPPKGSPVGHTKKWLGLDNLCYQFGLEGKMGDLKELAKKYNEPKTKIADLNYGLIPLDDPEFLAYAEQDVIALRSLFHYLMGCLKDQNYDGEYMWREMALLSATVGQMSSNGILVDQDYATKKIAIQEKKKNTVMVELVEKYDFPTEGKSPWASNPGKAAILEVFADVGITPENTPDWPRTPTGAPKLGGEELKALAEGTDAEEFAEALASVKGLRTTSQQVMDALQPDGRVHPEITSLQKSGRWSFTKPGVTIFGERTEELKQDKKLFKASPGKVLAGFDFSNADPRAMAALSGDTEFAVRFETDDEGNALHDGHNLTGVACFGEEIYYGGLPIDSKPPLRPGAKEAGNSLNYHIGAYTLANALNRTSKRLKLGTTFWAPAGKGAPAIPKYEDSIPTKEMIIKFDDTYPWLKRFKLAAVEEGERFGYVTNAWGRRMKVDKGKEYTQGPAMHGQSATREMMGDAILRLVDKGDYYIRAMRALIHDELLMEFDEATVDRDIAVMKECMEHVFDPGTPVSMPILFPVGHGYGKDWAEASH